jgi:hypothetical protein
VAWNDGHGNAGETTVREGEQVFLPKGYQYTLNATGETAVNVFAIAGGAPNVSAIKPEAGAMLQAAAKTLGR